ncbi:hypothetical protein CEP51_014182 [Fusarium floridanum]|uniref:C2H2-type domain-containing protein n=1 Tax=Fusarium floridanum TaxID=1325733 RepID=A0A428PXR9_9HYPO|nr:hypothetical protein CEP51_014182 [Fusarium floridanum]
MDTKEDESIYRLACECERLLDQCINGQESQEYFQDSARPGRLLAEYQLQFAAWAAHSGVFAKKSLCLDRRLSSLPDLQDLVIRLLDTLRRTLVHLAAERRNGPNQTFANVSEGEPRHEPSTPIMDALEMIEEVLGRLNRLGNAIRQASSGGLTSRVKRFAGGLDLTRFEALSHSSVRALYPSADQSLQSHLSRFMTNSYERILYIRSRHKALQADRPKSQAQLVPIVKEQDILVEDLPNIITAKPRLQSFALAGTQQSASLPQIVPNPGSELSSMNTRVLRAELRGSQTTGSRRHKTSSIQIKQFDYPPAPQATGPTNVVTCDWCFETHPKKDMEGSNWKRHLDKDFEPYLCIAEKCLEPCPRFKKFEDWLVHMQTQHGRRWHREIYKSSSWICPVCEGNPEEYTDPQALLSHMQDTHSHNFTPEQLHMMMRQSRAYIPRPPDECPLCYYKIPAEDGKNQPQGLVARRQSTFGKRQKGPLQEQGGKTARRAVESSHPEPHQSLDSTVDNSDIESEHSSSSDMPRTPLSVETVARHVASHLQVLMFLTIRMITLQLNTEEALSDLPGDSVDVDGGSDSSWRNDFETISDIEVEETTKPDSSESVDPDVSPDEEHPFILPSALGDTDHGRGEVEGMDGWGYIREVIKQEEADTQATTLSLREQTDLISIEYRYPKATVNLQRHLARSIAFRRKRLLDTQSHSPKLSTWRRDGRGENSLPSIPESPHTKQENSSKEEGENVTETTHRITLPRSWTDESKLKLGVFELSRSQAAVTSRRPAYQVEEPNVIDVNYPKPSAIGDGAAYFSCPFCQEILSASDMTDRFIWRRHVNRDIQPYVCLYYTCSTSFFSNYRDWVVHMEGAHSLDWIKNISKPFAWQCPLEQDSQLFNAPDKLLRHLKDFHSMAPSDVPSDCERWLEDQKVAVPPQQDLCPLCGFLIHAPDTVQEDVDSVGSEAAKRVRFGPEPTPRSDVSRQEMSRHIGSHLLSIALTSLDEHDVEKGDELDWVSSNVASSRGSNGAQGDSLI